MLGKEPDLRELSGAVVLAGSRKPEAISQKPEAISGIEQTTERVLRRCRELGFALAGVADAGPSAYERELRAWLDAGKHGEMQYLARHTAGRLDPARFVPGARSVICVADRYHDGAADPQEPSSGGPRGRKLAAAGRDRHHRRD